MNSVLDGTTTKSMIGKNVRTQAYMQEYFFEHFKHEDHSCSVENVFIAFMDTKDARDPKTRENY